MIPIKYDKKNKAKARTLRKNMTPEERNLWYGFLKTYPCQFRRQKQFGSYIVDFYCAQAKLVIELDGSQHYTEEAQEYDRERTNYLNSLGLEVIRISNLDVSRKFQSVCEYIDNAVKERTSSTASRSPFP